MFDDIDDDEEREIDEALAKDFIGVLMGIAWAIVLSTLVLAIAAGFISMFKPEITEIRENDLKE